MIKRYRFNLINWLTFLLCSATLSAFQSKHKHSEILTTYLIQILDTKTAQTEGLVGSTLVKVIDGYAAIVTLQNNDVIAGTSNELTQQIILNQSTPVSYVFEIQLATTNGLYFIQSIFAAPKQQFYDTLLQKWVCAEDLTSNNHIGHQQVISCRKVQKITWVYQLTTQQHVFTIESDAILVHNANISATNMQPLIFGACSCAHPVVAAIGRTISLAKLAMSIYEMYQDVQSRAQGLLSAMQEEEVVVTTRSYYETRRKELLKLLEQYQALKQSVIALSNKSTAINLLFSTISIAQVSQSLLPSLQSELTYGPADKQKLLQLREKELTSIETEINSLQITLMLHLQDHSDRLAAHWPDVDNIE